MLAEPQRFVTLLGAPGLFPIGSDPAEWAEALGERAVLSSGTRNVVATHDSLVAEGVDSIFVEFTGEQHMVSPEFDEGVSCEFWGAH